MNIKEFLDRQRHAARRRSTTDGTANLPSTACAPEAQPTAENPNIARKEVLGKAAAASDTRAFSLFLELIIGGM
jgi:hypothetical protein